MVFDNIIKMMLMFDYATELQKSVSVVVLIWKGTFFYNYGNSNHSMDLRGFQRLIAGIEQLQHTHF
jgi:hypothetical protein